MKFLARKVLKIRHSAFLGHTVYISQSYTLAINVVFLTFDGPLHCITL